MCNRVISEDSFMLIYCPYRYKTQKMSDEAVDDCLAVSKFIIYWFVTSKMLEKIHYDFLANSDIIFFDEDSSHIC